MVLRARAHAVKVKLLKKVANNLIRILWVINLAEIPTRGIYCPVRNLPCPIEPTIRPSKPICFIAIPTGEEWKDTNRTVKEALEEKGVFPYVAVEDITAGRDILCKICERILGSTFGIVELTEKNINVMFEFGLILGRSKPVFILYNKKLAEKISPHIPTDIIALERIEYSALHQGSSQNPRSTYSRILFVEPSATTNIFHNNILNAALNIDVRIFCNDIVSGALTWLQQNQNSQNYIQNYGKFMQRYPNGLAPYLVGVPVIG